MENTKPPVTKRLVIVSDIRSSTSILEDLKATDNLDRWRNLLFNLKEDVIEEGIKLGIEIYKFIGDGWILFAPPNISKGSLRLFIQTLSVNFDFLMGSRILELLSRKPDSLGLTFGIDTGELAQMEMGGQVEYVGRAINVAARLQSEAKKQGDGDAYTIMISKNAYALTAGKFVDLEARPVKVSLKNIGGGAPIDCFIHDVKFRHH